MLFYENYLKFVTFKEHEIRVVQSRTDLNKRERERHTHTDTVYEAALNLPWKIALAIRRQRMKRTAH